MSSLREIESLENQVEESITEKNRIAEMIMIDNLIKGLEALNMSSNELEIILDVLKN